MIFTRELWDEKHVSTKREGIPEYVWHQNHAPCLVCEDKKGIYMKINYYD